MALVSVLAKDQHWARRQTFILLCQALLDQEAGWQGLRLEIWRHCEEYIIFSPSVKLCPPLLLLSSDPVPNVRLSLAALLLDHQEEVTFINTIRPNQRPNQRTTDRPNK